MQIFSRFGEYNKAQVILSLIYWFVTDHVSPIENGLYEQYCRARNSNSYSNTLLYIYIYIYALFLNKKRYYKIVYNMTGPSQEFRLVGPGIRRYNISYNRMKTQS